MNITTASVKVMRSFDYCHFEVCLGFNESVSVQDVDELRKDAARLADKAVEQYKIAKRNAELSEGDEYRLLSLRRRCEEAEAKSESDRSPQEKAAIKYFRDRAFHRNRPHYDYEDDFSEPDWNEDDDGVAF